MLEIDVPSDRPGPTEVRPRRSALFVPAINARAIEKARDLPADIVILDLEDAVAPEMKEEARAAAVAAARAGGWGSRELVIRVNGERTDWHRDDLVAVADSGATAVLVPKIDDGSVVVRAAATLSMAHASDSLRLWGMIETAAAVLAAETIASAHRRAECLVMGPEDLGNELRVPQSASRMGLLYALSKTLVAARANGLDLLDGPYTRLDDAQGLEAAAQQSRALGMDGKCCIHPDQLAVVNRVMSPSPDEVERARRIVAGYDAARAAGKGIAVVDGRMIEELHADAARRVIAMAEAIAA